MASWGTKGSTAMPVTAIVVDHMATPSTMVGLLGVAPGLIGSIYTLLWTLVMVSAACPRSVSGAITSIAFLLMTSWNACNDV